jgi:hypothetical protein
MHKQLLGLAGSLVLSTAIATPTQAAIFASEVGDAGQSLATAQVITATGADTALASISGRIGPTSGVSPVDDADLYKFVLTANVAFNATVTSNTSAGGVFDTALSLFDGNGNGVFFNDDASGTNSLSAISFIPTASGVYYLGISNYSYFAKDASNKFIFPDTSAFPGANPTGLYGPVAGAGALASWGNGASGFVGDFGTYTINLTGATAAVPEPSTAAGLLAVALMGLGARRRKKA